MESMVFSGFKPKDKHTAEAVAALIEEHKAAVAAARAAKAKKSSALKAKRAIQKAGAGLCC